MGVITWRISAPLPGLGIQRGFWNRSSWNESGDYTEKVSAGAENACPVSETGLGFSAQANGRKSPQTVHITSALAEKARRVCAVRSFSRKENGLYLVPSWNLSCNFNNFSARTEIRHVIKPLDSVQNCNDHVKLMHISAVSYRLNNEMFWRFLFSGRSQRFTDPASKHASERYSEKLLNFVTNVFFLYQKYYVS